MTKERLNEIVNQVRRGLAPKMTGAESSEISWTYVKFYPFRPAKIVFKINYEKIS